MLALQMPLLVLLKVTVGMMMSPLASQSLISSLGHIGKSVEETQTKLWMSLIGHIN